MNASTPNLLRRTLAVAGVLSSFALAMPAAAQTVTLSGTTTNSCPYSTMTVSPNGAVMVTCQNTSVSQAVFSLAGSGSMLVGATQTITVSRSGGPAEELSVSYLVSGAGCTTATPSGVMAFAQNAAAQSIVITAAAAAGSCTVAITPPSGHLASPNTLNISVSTGSTEPPPPPGCPAIPLNALARTLPWGPVDQLRMSSGQIAYYEVIAANSPKNSVAFTQGQQPNTPAGVVTEMSVSKCPGVIDQSVPQCYRTSPYSNNNAITIYRTPVYGWDSQAKLSNRGCWAPQSEGKWYVNVRWTYPGLCPYSTGCGFSMQWANGAY